MTTHAAIRSTRKPARRVAVASDAGSHLAAIIKELVAFFGNEQMLVRLTGLSLRSIANYKSGQRIVRGSNERRIIELARLKKALGTIMKPAAVPDWLQRPNSAFKDLKPIEVIERGNTDQIWRLIHLAQAGSHS